MEGKTVILSVLIMSLVMAQIQVEANKVCCPTRPALDNYNQCRKSTSAVECAEKVCCRLVPDSNSCPPGFSFSGPSVNEYCNLWCESSVCGALTNLKNSDASEIALDQQVNEALEKCTKACSTFCATGSNTAPDQKIALDQIA